MYKTEVPKTVEEVLKDKHWKKVVEDEINALHKNVTWRRFVLPKGKKLVG